jgi:uroporphyrinogen decarboxylase
MRYVESKREVVKIAIEGKQPPYVPWHCSFTQEAAEKIINHFGSTDVDRICDNHFVDLGSGIGYFEHAGPNQVKDIFGVIWDRSVDKDIGVVCNCVLKEPSVKGLEIPDPLSDIFFWNIPAQINAYPDCYRRFVIGFSLYERAWTLRGMENLLIDFYAHPEFVEELFRTIADFNIAQIEHALEFDIDAVHFGDDWGQQHGLQMGPAFWKQFIYPELKRMFQIVRDAGKHVSLHSCGDVDELFDELIDIGLNCFNPFQPEVMDVYSLMKKYRGRLAFHGGLSTQKTLPFGSQQDVQSETIALLNSGKKGGYIFAPAHAVESDVPLENMVTFLEAIKNQ